MITKTIKLGEREYEVKALTIREADVWREKLDGPFAKVVEVLEGAEDVELRNVKDLAGLLRTVTGTMVDSPKTIRNLLFDYAPNLKADADWILDNAYDEEIFDAFVEVLKLAFPFGKMAQMFRGQGRRGTSRK